MKINKNLSITYHYIYIYIYIYKVGDHSQGEPKAPFSLATTPRCRGVCNSFTPLYL